MDNQWIILLLVTVPAITVAVVAYYLLYTMLQRQQQHELYELGRNREQTTLPLRLQAYERLSLFCERIAVPNLLLRTSRVGLTASQFRATLLLTVQQEFEHNVTQQVYVSTPLWEIIKASRDDVAQLIAMAADRGGSGDELAQRLLSMLAERGNDPLVTAQMAIRREAATLFGQ